MTKLQLRCATVDDARRLWEWRNEPAVREASLDTHPVEWNQHIAWLDGKLRSDDCRLWILEVFQRPAGMIRYDRKSDAAEISIALETNFRGQGLGSQLLAMSLPAACRELGVRRAFGVVKEANLASRRAFERAGFTRLDRVVVNEIPCFLYQCSCRPARTGTGTGGISA